MHISRTRGEWGLILLLALFKLAIHLLTSTNYGLHRDAFLYLALGDHLAFGYLSVPPSIAVVARTTGLLFGDSVFAVRLFPALIGAASVVVIARIVKILGGEMWGILLSCAAFIVSPAFLRSNSLFQPVTFNQFYWLLSSYFMVRMLQARDPKFWIHLSIVWGLGFLNKYSIAFLVVAFCLSLLITEERRLFLSRYFPLGVLFGLIIVSPNLLWQLNHKWPVVTHMRELQQTQLIHVNIVDFLAMQLLMNLPGLLIWVVGLAFLLLSKEARRWRVLAYTYLMVLLILILLRGKHYYSLGVYPVLFAFGGFAIEKFFRKRLRVLRPVLLLGMVVVMIPILPYSLPLLPYDQMIRYGEESRKLGLSGPLRWEDGRIHALPQDYADMVGWQELGDAVIRAYNGLSESERSRCGIYAENYGEAGAIKYFGRKHGLPEPICFNGSFLFWAPDSVSNGVLIYVNSESGEISYFFSEVEQVGRISNPYARESGLPVFLCKGPRNGFREFYAQKVKRLKDRYR